ncbi:peptidylprolyl isomerase [Chitinophaga horti]|uniref:Peptidylprolyl isomerase n=1 Tax=Chitinophaga horti TaxID=2920382 RepID=A0ABY6J2X8_9BACT|nr:peptidylprolyl isomerase [Chitinophaga horti]UYQ92711.1 peptidylprolyl isomerase [Chitinophaga horti]
MKKLLILSAATLCLASAASAQTRYIVDKIVAKVGDKIILRSEVESGLVDFQKQALDQPLPANASCSVLERLIAHKVLVLQAERDSLPINDGDVSGRIESQIRYFEQVYGTRQKMEEITGYTVYQLRERFREPIREQMLADAMRDKIVGSVKVTPTEVKTNFERIPKDSLPFYESELEVGQLVIIPKAGTEMESYAKERLLDFKKRAEGNTADFGTLARLYSEDPGVKENGGVYTLNRNDKNMWDPTFLSAAFRLKEGEISQPVKSQFGYHLIKMLRRQGDNVNVQHILLKANVTNDDMTAATKKIDSLRGAIIAGKTTFADAVYKYSDLPDAKFTGGMIADPNTGATLITIDQLNDPSMKDIVLALNDLKPGELSKPMAYKDERNGNGMRIVYLKTRSQPHRENLQDDYARIQERALKIKQAETLNKWLLDKIPTFYVDVEQEFKNCNNVAQWMNALAKQ